MKDDTDKTLREHLALAGCDFASLVILVTKKPADRDAWWGPQPVHKPSAEEVQALLESRGGGYGSRFPSFRAWDARRVYFQVEFDGYGSVDSVPRHPECSEAEEDWGAFGG